MVEAAERLRLAREAFAEARLRRQRRRQQLDRDAAAEAAVVGAVDRAHAAAADLLLELDRAAEQHRRQVGVVEAGGADAGRRQDGAAARAGGAGHALNACSRARISSSTCAASSRVGATSSRSSSR